MAVAILLPAPELQFCDADGHPYAGGSLATYVPGTTTPKTCWLDPGETAVQTNPVILDAAGRCIIYGDGDYRLILRDAAGNLIYDQLSSTVISAAMRAFVSAPTLADAKDILGVTSDISTESTARAAADSTEQTARIAADNTEITRAEAAEAGLATAITEVVNQIGLGAYYLLEGGNAMTDGSGHHHVTFSQPYGSTPFTVATAVTNSVSQIFVTLSDGTSTGVDIFAGNSSGVGVAVSVNWIVYGR